MSHDEPPDQRNRDDWALRSDHPKNGIESLYGAGTCRLNTVLAARVRELLPGGMPRCFRAQARRAVDCVMPDFAATTERWAACPGALLTCASPSLSRLAIVTW